MVIPYATVNKNGTWRGVGDRIYRGKHLVFFFEKNIKRVQDKSLTKIQFAFEINGVAAAFTNVMRSGFRFLRSLKE
jgi:hypothetical protein